MDLKVLENVGFEEFIMSKDRVGGFGILEFEELLFEEYERDLFDDENEKNFWRGVEC